MLTNHQSTFIVECWQVDERERHDFSQMRKKQFNYVIYSFSSSSSVFVGRFHASLAGRHISCRHVRVTRIDAARQGAKSGKLGWHACTHAACSWIKIGVVPRWQSSIVAKRFRVNVEVLPLFAVLGEMGSMVCLSLFFSRWWSGQSEAWVWSKEEGVPFSREE